MKKFMAEFKEFISRGNVVDMAVGVVGGSAFTAIVNSLVKDVIMPFIGWLIGGIDFSQFKIVLAPAVGDTPEVAILYGTFINQLRRKKEEEPEPEPEAPAEPPVDVQLLTEIRDLLKAQSEKAE